MYDDTIAAVATAGGDAGIGVIRISGPEAFEVLRRVFRPRPAAAEWVPVDSFPESRRVYYGRAIDASTSETIDEVLAFAMPAPRSYTREDVAEIQCHGGAVPLQRVLLAVLRAGARMATPGEFTLRAFLHGRIDLAQAEAVADVIRSTTDRALALAMKGLEGELSGRVRGARQRLLRVLAYLEATIDFSEDDLPLQDTRGPLLSCLEEVTTLLATSGQGIICRQGVRVAIVGRPNVGKSSLLNALLGNERAIVTEIAGTTRDTLEEAANFEGVPFCLVDTAGIVTSTHPVEMLGVERSRRAIKEADLCLLVVDSSNPLQAGDRDIASATEGKSVIIVANKSDLVPAVAGAELSALVDGATVVATSIPERLGLPELRNALLVSAFSGAVAQSEELLVSNPRHQDVLTRARIHLEEALSSQEIGLPVDCTASDVRLAVDALGEITGETASEDLLDSIFSNFCVGK